jgi:hypothetical protein
MTVNPNELEREHTLLTATARYDELRLRDSLADTAATMLAEDPDLDLTVAPLSRDEALSMLALGEVIARKAGYGRQLAVRSARAAGASWSQIGEALGQTKQAAWEAHSRWIDGLAAAHRDTDVEGLDAQDVAAARRLAGVVDDEIDDLDDLDDLGSDPGDAGPGSAS